MRVIRNKLKEKSGVSIFMGLIFLMVCLMVGTVVLTASTAAAGKLARQRETEQDYLNVSSAARLIKNRIGALTYNHKRVHIDGGTIDSITRELTASGTMILKDKMEGLCQKLVEEEPPALSGVTEPFAITFTSGSGTPAVTWKPVYGGVRMDATGKITVGLWLGNTAVDSTESHNHIKLEFSPDSVVNTSFYVDPDDGTTTTTTYTTYRWPEDGCIITKGRPW